MSDKIYLIYRTYSRKEKEEFSHRQDHLFGWTRSSSLIKAFLMQRDNKKYKVIKTNREEIADVMSENYLDDETEMDYINLKSASTGAEIKFYTNKDELSMIESNIQQYFSDLCSFDKYDVNTMKRIIDMISHLDDIYDEALEVIGFRPREMESLFPGQDDEWVNEIHQDIFNAYNSYQISKRHSIPGLEAMTDVSKKIYYSLESFIKVLVEDL